MLRRPRAQTSFTHALTLPPPFRLVMLRELGDAFLHACAHAAELGAGTLVFVGRFDLAEFAVVLEPDEPLASSWRVLYAGMVALTNALAGLAPPEKAIVIEWPDTIRVDGGLVGGGRLAWPNGIDHAKPPPWLVFGAMIRTVSLAGDGGGLHPRATALEDEGFGDQVSERLIEAFARHLMLGFDHWPEAGFAVVSNRYVSQLDRGGGVRNEIGDNGDLLTTRIGKPIERRRLNSNLAVPSWLDPSSGVPRE